MENLTVIEKNITDSVLNKVKSLQNANALQLPANYSCENALKSAYLALQEVKGKNGNLALETCSQNSIANTLLDMVVQGLNPLKKQCYFIPYGDKLTLMRSYQGSIAVAKRFAGVKNVNANVIYENDDLDFEVDVETGAKKLVHHKTALENMNNKIIGAYAVTILEDNSRYLEIMTINEIEKSWSQGSGKGKAHNDFTHEMAKKTVINRAMKHFINNSDDSCLLKNTIDEEEKDTYISNAIDMEIQEKANDEVLEFDDYTEDDIIKEDVELMEDDF
ncbi:MAG: recombinase RecT [Lachnospirales bacterium]